MSANTTPLFTRTGIATPARISTANVNRDGSTGTYGTIVTAGADGTRVDGIRITANAAIAGADVVRIFRKNGSNIMLVDEVLIPVTTPSTSVKTYVTDWTPPFPLFLASGDTIIASTDQGNSYSLNPSGGHF